MNRILLLLLAALLPCSMTAQQKSKAKANPAPAVAVPPEPTLTPQEERMLNGLEKVVIFDSLVVSKRDLFKAYPLSPSAGTLAWADDNTALADSLLTLRPTRHVIAYGDKRIESCPVDSASSRIGISMRFGGEWTTAEPLFTDADAEENCQNFPYIMADGQTIYFAQQASDGLGGLDLYMTRQNGDRSGFYRPENIGMPFNSCANDYLLVIDEENGFGMFASDRRQATDSVCIYYFIPSEQRNTYDEDNLSQEERIALAEIRQITDTWGFGDKEKIEALREKLRKSLSLIK